MKKRFLALLCLILVAALFGSGPLPSPSEVRAQAPLETNLHLWQRLMGMIEGPWVGQIDPIPAAKPGETYDLFIYYSNNGPAVRDVSLVDYMPTSTSLVSVSAQPPIQWSPDDENHAIVIDIGDMPEDDPGGTIHLIVRVASNASARTELVNTVLLVSAGVEQDRSVTAPTIVQAPEFSYTIKGPTLIRRCTDVEYTTTFTNRGNLGAVDATLTITLPVGLEPQSYIPAPTTITRVVRVCPGVSNSGSMDQIEFSSTLDQLPQSQVYQYVLIWADAGPLNIDDSFETVVNARVQQNCATYAGIVGTFRARIESRLNPLAIVSQEVRLVGTMQAGPCPKFLPHIIMNYDREGTERDAQEYDDLPEQATTVEVDGEPTQHTLHKVKDEDWLRFLAYPGYSYLVEVYDLEGSEPPTSPPPTRWAPRTDPVLTIYEPKLDPLSPHITGTLIYEEDDRDFPNDFGAEYTIASNTHGYYYIRIQQYNPLPPFDHQWKYEWPIDTSIWPIWPPYLSDTGYKVRITTVGSPTMAPSPADPSAAGPLEPTTRTTMPSGDLTRRAR